MVAVVSGTVAYWRIEAVRDGVDLIDPPTYFQGAPKQARELAEQLLERVPESWIPDVVIGVRPLTRAEFIENFLA